MVKAMHLRHTVSQTTSAAAAATAVSQCQVTEGNTTGSSTSASYDCKDWINIFSGVLHIVAGTSDVPNNAFQKYRGISNLN